MSTAQTGIKWSFPTLSEAKVSGEQAVGIGRIGMKQ